MKKPIAESEIEGLFLSFLEEMDYTVLTEENLADDEAIRSDITQVILEKPFEEALYRINPDLPQGAIDEARRKALRPVSPSLEENNLQFHKYLREGVDVRYSDPEKGKKHEKVWLMDSSHPENNHWMAINQFDVKEGGHHRRPDVVVFLNGLPIAVVELKNPSDEKATIKSAFRQLQTYKREIPSLFHFNQLMVVSDGLQARVGSLSANWDRFMPWRTVDGEKIQPLGMPEMEVMAKGIFDRKRLLDYLRYFITFESDGEKIIKKIGAYHQYFAVNKAVDCTLKAAGKGGDQRAGVIWHPQGSGKSLSMVFYAGKLIQQREMANPTLVLLTDRNDLDDQLLSTFARNQALLGQKPEQAENREHLQELLSVAAGGIVFTTIQKFFPEEKGKKYPRLSDRRNIVVIADEAHRSQYDFIKGFARHMRDALPEASFIGFTGTPIEFDDKNTPAVFGDYIDIYDIQRAVEDQSTVPIYYESRLAKIDLKEEEQPRIDPAFEEITEGEEEDQKEKIKSKWSRLEALVGTEKRVGMVAKDLVDHIEKRWAVMEGKAMIVCMSRRICVDLYEAIVRLRPDWHGEEDQEGIIKVVMTGSASDPEGWQDHVRSKMRRKELAERFKDPRDKLKIVIVRDMWLTGFDAPCLHTMYVDKPMRGHNLMQAIARVNRVFGDKPGGLVVDYLGIAHYLKLALEHYSDGDRKAAGIDQEMAVNIMVEKYEIVRDMFHGFDYSGFWKASSRERLEIIPRAMEHILKVDLHLYMEEEGGKNPEKHRFMKAVSELSRAFALAVPHERAMKISDEVGFFQLIRANINKYRSRVGERREEDIEAAVRQLISQAISTDDVVDIFSAAGLQKPDISILSDEFLEDVKKLPHKNVAVELLQKLIKDEIQTHQRTNLVQSRSFSKLLQETINRYYNKTLETAQIVMELIELAKQIREAKNRGEELGLSTEELAFYDALDPHDTYVKVMGDDQLKTIACELAKTERI